MHEAAFGAAVGRLGPHVLDGLNALEQAFRRLHPPAFPALRSYLSPILDALDTEIVPFETLLTPSTLEAFHSDLFEAGRLTREALAALVEPGAMEEGAARALSAMHQHAQGAGDTLSPSDGAPALLSVLCGALCARSPRESGSIAAGLGRGPVSRRPISFWRSGRARRLRPLCAGELRGGRRRALAFGCRSSRRRWERHGFFVDVAARSAEPSLHPACAVFAGQYLVAECAGYRWHRSDPDG